MISESVSDDRWQFDKGRRPKNCNKKLFQFFAQALLTISPFPQTSKLHFCTYTALITITVSASTEHIGVDQTVIGGVPQYASSSPLNVMLHLCPARPVPGGGGGRKRLVESSALHQSTAILRCQTWWKKRPRRQKQYPPMTKE